MAIRMGWLRSSVARGLCVLGALRAAGCSGALPEAGSSSDAGGADAPRPPSADAASADVRAGPEDSSIAPLQPSLALQVRCASAVVAGLQWGSVAGAAHYGVTRAGATLGTTVSTYFSDITVSPTSAYAYAVSAYDAKGASLVTSTINLTTPAATASGDAPYCPSDLIRSITWNWPSGYNQQNGSDLWSSTWGADGNVYLFFGDGGGFFGSNTDGRASFGIARITGTSAIVTAADATNIYGGHDAAHPSTVNGKAGSILAVGSSFYALGGIYGSGDTGGPSGAPNHYEIVASIGDAYSWQDTPWDFCAADANGNVTHGTLCAVSFVSFGAGNAGALDSYVYMAAVPAQGWFGGTAPTPASTYLMRAPGDLLTTESAYAYYAGLDPSGQPVWSPSALDAQPIFTDRNSRGMGLGPIVYNPVLKRFIGASQGATVSAVALYEAESVWGPWSTISYENTNPDGTGGWGGLGSSSYAPGHGDSLGINMNGAWISQDGLTMWATFSSDGTAPATALLPGLAGQSMDSFSLVSFTLRL
jgi:hypothetical protein